MARILVAYGTKHGATAEIAEAIADELRRSGAEVACTPAGEVADLSAYDGVVLGSAVYMKRWRGDARRLLHRRAKELGARPLWLFSSGPIGEDADFASPWCSPRDVLERAVKLGARDHRVFGGRVPLDPQNFMARAMQRDTPAEYSDLRDSEDIRAWARGIATELEASRAGAVA